MQIPIEMLFLCVKDGGFTKFETTPGGGFNAGVVVAILPAFEEVCSCGV